MREHSGDELVSHYIELFKNELDTMLYGNNPSFAGRNVFIIHSRYNMWKANVKYTLKKYLKTSNKKNLANDDLKNVLTTNTYGTEEDFVKFGIRLFSTNLRSPLKIINDKPFRNIRELYASMLRSGTYHSLLKRDNLEQLEKLKEDIADALVNNKITAFFTHNDEEFWNKYMIEVCRKAGIPSFEFLHGLPGVYTQDINTRTDYLCVWGNKLKDNYVTNGFEGKRIYVTGAPRFSKFAKRVDTLRNTFDDVLVAPSTACVCIQHGWVMDENGDQNDSLLILYIYQVEHVLKQLGVTHARLRPHLSVDYNWVAKYVDTDFYTFDYEPVNDSLKRATMIIGPHSTLMMDALCNGVNYYVYDPGEKGYTVRGSKMVPPFDGKDGCVHIAQNEEELIRNIQNKIVLDPRFLDGYLSPFDLTPIMNLF